MQFLDAAGVIVESEARPAPGWVGLPPIESLPPALLVEGRKNFLYVHVPAPTDKQVPVRDSPVMRVHTPDRIYMVPVRTSSAGDEWEYDAARRILSKEEGVRLIRMIESSDPEDFDLPDWAKSRERRTDT